MACAVLVFVKKIVQIVHFWKHVLLIYWCSQQDPVTVTTTQTTTTIYPPANSEVIVTMEAEPSTKPTNPELSKAPPPTYKDASNYSDAPSELPPPQYNDPPPQYSADFPPYSGPEVDPPAGKCW